MTKWLQGICDNAKRPQNFETEDTANRNKLREAIPNKKSRFYGHFPYGGGAQPHSIAFGGVLTNFTEAIFG